MSFVISESCYRQWAVHAKPYHQRTLLSFEKATSDPELCQSRSRDAIGEVTRHLLPWLLQFSARWPFCVYSACTLAPLQRVQHAAAGLTLNPVPSILLQLFSSCTGFPLSIALSSRSQHRCIIFSTTAVRRTSPTCCVQHGRLTTASSQVVNQSCCHQTNTN